MPQKQTPQQSLGFILSDVARMWRRAFNRRAYDLGLTQAQWQALAHISLNQGMRQAQLADILEVQPISVAGWICRKPDPDDRRAINLYPTQKAEPILSKMQAYAAEVRMFALEGVSEAEQQSLRQALMAIKKNLAEEEGKKET